MVYFSTLPFSLPAPYELQRHISPAVSPISTVLPPAQSPHSNVPAPFKLSINGAKTFGVTVDDRGSTKTQQGLQLAVNGQLTETVTLNAAISDRLSERLSSGAASSRLNELDEFFIEVQSPALGARLGEIAVEQAAGRTGGERRLAGAQARYTTENQQLSASAGKHSGITRARELSPAPGNQGPYPLSERRNPIVPNSEMVYLDGRALDRGEDRDYTIDYFNGEITFSPRLFLAETQHIRVEFEEGAQNYLRRAVFTDWRSREIIGGLSNRLAWQWETDDPDAGVGFVLTPADRDTLNGVNGSTLVRDGAQYVGAGNGEYVLRQLGDQQVYEYVGPDEGDYDVRLEYVGAAQGSYVHLGGGAFGFIGDSLGDYQPLITIAAPASHMSFTDRLDLPQSAIGAVRMTMAATTLQANRFNESSRQNILSHDLQWSSSSMEEKSASAKRFHLSSRWRRLGDFGRPDDNIRVDDLTRAWYLPVNLAYAAESIDVLESSGKLALAPRTTLNLEYGALAGPFDGRRDGETLEIGLSSAFSGVLAHQRSRVESGLSDSARTRESWSAGEMLHLGRWELSAKLRRDDRYASGFVGDRFDGYEITLGRGNLRLTHAADRVYAMISTPALTETRRRLSVDGPWLISQLGLSGSLTATRISRRRQADNRLFLDHLGSSELRWHWPRQALEASATYALNRIGAREQIDSYIPVTDGYGTYRREEDIFVPDPAGDYTRVIGATGTLRPNAAGQKEFIMRRSYGTPDDKRPLPFKDVMAELSLIREEQLDPEYISISGWLVPWGRLKTAGTGAEYTLVRRETSGSIERRLPVGERYWFLRGRYRERFDSYGGQVMPVVNRRTTWELSARGRFDRSGWENWEVSGVRSRQVTDGYASIAGLQLLSHRGELSGSYRTSPNVLLSSALSVEHLADQAAATDFVICGLAPSATFRFGPRGEHGSVKPGLEYRYVATAEPRELIPGIGDAFSSGHNLRIVVDGRLGISGSVSASVRTTLDMYERRASRFRLNVYAVSKF